MRVHGSFIHYTFIVRLINEREAVYEMTLTHDRFSRGFVDWIPHVFSSLTQRRVLNGLRHEKWPFSGGPNTDKMCVHGSIQHKECRHHFQNPSIYSSFASRATRRLGLVVLLGCVSRDVFDRISCQNSCSLYQSTTSDLRVLLYFSCHHSLLAPSFDFALWIKGIGDIINGTCVHENSNC